MFFKKSERTQYFFNFFFLNRSKIIWEENIDLDYVQNKDWFFYIRILLLFFSPD